MSNYELYHFGIKGQKWGLRRYQNEDGSLTAEGKKRYGYVSQSTKNYAAKYGMKSEQYKRSLELDDKISQRYASSSKLKNIAKSLAMSPSMRMTYEMARAMGKGRAESIARTYFDLNGTVLISSLMGGAAGAIAGEYASASSRARGDLPTFASNKGSQVGRVVSGLSARAFDAGMTSTGNSLSLQQQSLRKSYIIDGNNKKKKR